METNQEKNRQRQFNYIIFGHYLTDEEMRSPIPWRWVVGGIVSVIIFFGLMYILW